MKKTKCLCTLSKCTHPNMKCSNGPTRRYLTDDFDLDLCFDCSNRREELSGKSSMPWDEQHLQTSAEKRRSAPWMIAFYLGWDIKEISEARYQPTRYHAPSVYSGGDSYFCCPSGSQQPPKDLGPWTKVFSEYGRDVYKAN